MRSLLLVLVSFSFLFVSAAFATQPNPNLTPGVLCTPQDPNFAGFTYPSHVARCRRNVSTNEKLQIAAEYGNIPQAKWPNYEFDHLIPLCVGGSDDIRNIWPQPINEAHQKDVLENQVCLALQAGTMDQQQALQKISEWIAAH